MAITKIPDFSFKHVDQADRPSATAAAMKANLDSRAKNIRDTFNNLNVTELTEGAYNYAASTTGTDAYAVTIPNFAAYTVGATVKFKADVANTGACTLNVNSLGAKAIVGSNGSALADGDIAAGAVTCVIYDGTNFQTSSNAQLIAHTANTTTAHGSTSAATANTIVLRNAAGQTQVAAPSAAADVARKDTVDAVQTNLTTHTANTTNPHNVTQIQVGLGSVENLTATQIRQATDRGLQVEVRDSYPAHAQGKVIFHTVEGKFKGSTGTEWL